MSYNKMKIPAVEADLNIKLGVVANVVVNNNLFNDAVRERFYLIFDNINPAYREAFEWFDNSQFAEFIRALAKGPANILIAPGIGAEFLDQAALDIIKLNTDIFGDGVAEEEEDESWDEEDNPMGELLGAAYALLMSHMAEDLTNGGERIRMVTFWDSEEIDSEFSSLVRGFYGESHPVNNVTIAEALKLSVSNPSEDIFELFDEPIQKLAYALSVMTDENGLHVYQGNGYTIALDPETAILVTDHPSLDMYEAINHIEVMHGEE